MRSNVLHELAVLLSLLAQLSEGALVPLYLPSSVARSQSPSSRLLHPRLDASEKKRLEKQVRAFHKSHRETYRLLREKGAETTASATAASGVEAPIGASPLSKRGLPSLIFFLNAATKWIVVFAQTSAIIIRRDLVTPFIIIGSIFASFGTGKLKRLINEKRPEGAPFADPGMPSSHALVGSFACAAWAIHLASPLASASLGGAALVISYLRVACGYHTTAQVLVGMGIGTTSAALWMALGAKLLKTWQWARSPAVAWLLYGLYLGGSAAFIYKKMGAWVSKEEAML